MDLPHRQFVFAIPKALRSFFRHDRMLFSEVSRLIYRLMKDFYHEAAGTELMTGIVIAHQIFGDMLRWNPHFHAIVLEGGFDDEGTFYYIPFSGLDSMRAAEFLGGLDVLVNNAGITMNQPFMSTTVIRIGSDLFQPRK